MAEQAAGVAVASTTANDPSRRVDRRLLLLRRFLRNRTAVAGVAVLVTLVAIALFGPMFWSWDIDDVDRTAFLKPAGGEHPLGTTQAGRDMLALTLHGLRKSLLIGFAVALLSTAVAAVVGAFAACHGGWTERVSLWVIDLLLVIPAFLLIALVTGGGVQGSSSTWLLVVLLAVFGWMLPARVVRSLAHAIREREFVLAARFGSALVAHEFELIAFSWIGTPYPFSGIKQLYGTGSESNFAQLSLPEVDELADRIAIETDKAERIALANRADVLLWEAVHTLPLYQRPELIATRTTLANYGALGLSSLRWENIGYRDGE